MRLLAVALGLLLALGCDATSQSVPLVTFARDGCYVAPLEGQLVSDPQYGTRVVIADGSAPIVAWRPGFTANRKGSEVEVHAEQGAVAAITGRRYEFTGGFVKAGDVGIPDASLPRSTLVWWACGPVEPAR